MVNVSKTGSELNAAELEVVTGGTRKRLVARYTKAPSYVDPRSPSPDDGPRCQTDNQDDSPDPS